MQRASEDDIALMSRYAAAFLRRDPDAATDVYAVPALGVSASGTHAVVTREQRRDSLAQAYARYDADGITALEFECGRAFAFGDRVRQVEVRWIARRADGSTAIDASTWYVLQHDGENWKICVGISGEAR